MTRIENAVILAAGFSSRLLPISQYCPKTLLPVKGEVVIERQIRQLLEAGIPKVYVVVGYQASKFAYLSEKYPVKLILNPDYQVRNNHSSIHAVREYLGDSLICCGDNYFPQNPFSSEADRPFYTALYAHGPTQEWCLTLGGDGRINRVVIGGTDSWYMNGQSFWDKDFTRKFLEILEAEYHLPETKDRMWEHIYLNHLDTLSMYYRPCPEGSILEFDSLEDLKAVDPFYRNHTEEELAAYFQTHQPGSFV